MVEIILVRHGVAEDRAYELVDIDRELTKKGRERFKKQMVELMNKLDTDKDIVIWTSPALRASQTAEIIEDELETGNIFVHDFIYTGNFNSFLFELEKVEDDTILFVVGHEPDLSHWAGIIDGGYHRFRKGTMVSFEVTDKVTDKDVLDAEFKWVIHPSK